jgi:cell division protein FtsI/penicillin-binding protein 2
MNDLTKEMFDLYRYIYKKRYYDSFKEEWEKMGSPEITAKKDDGDWCVRYYSNEKPCGMISLFRLYAAAQKKAMRKAVDTAADFAEISKESVKDLDVWAFKWSGLQENITKRQYESFIEKYKEVYTLFFNAELARWNYPKDGPWREAFVPPEWGDNGASQEGFEIWA